MGANMGSLYSTWTGGEIPSPKSVWGTFPMSGQKSLSPPSHSPRQHSPGSTASEAGTERGSSVWESQQRSPSLSPSIGPSDPTTSPGLYFEHRTPTPPSQHVELSRTQSPSETMSSLSSTLYSTASAPYRENMATISKFNLSPIPSTIDRGASQCFASSGPGLHHRPSFSEISTGASNCDECGSKDSIAGGSCQICGHQRFVKSSTWRRTPSGYSYSSSYSNWSRTQVSQSTRRVGTDRNHNCPSCSASNSLNQGCCEVCGYESTPPQRLSSIKEPAQWVPFEQTKTKQDLSFALSGLKIRGANGQSREVVVPLLMTSIKPSHMSGSPSDAQDEGRWM